VAAGWRRGVAAVGGGEAQVFAGDVGGCAPSLTLRVWRCRHGLGVELPEADPFASVRDGVTEGPHEWGLCRRAWCRGGSR